MGVNTLVSNPHAIGENNKIKVLIEICGGFSGLMGGFCRAGSATFDRPHPQNV
jgi:hypothetical protein